MHLHSAIPDSLFEIEENNLVRLDHPNNIKKVEFAFTAKRRFSFEL